jgi:hypothetical protein
MLHGVEAEVRELGSFGMPVNGDYAALFVEFIVHMYRYLWRTQECVRHN